MKQIFGIVCNNIAKSRSWIFALALCDYGFLEAVLKLSCTSNHQW